MIFQTLSALEQEVNLRFAWPSPQQRNLKPEFHFTTLLPPTQRTYLDNQRIFPVYISLVGGGVKVLDLLIHLTVQYVRLNKIIINLIFKAPSRCIPHHNGGIHR